MSTATPEMKHHFAAVVDSDIDCMRHIEKNTRLQSKSKFWFEQREYRITASNFGSFCRMKEATDPVRTFKQKKKFFTTRSVRHGLNYEAMAFAKYVEKKPCQNCPVGLVVNPKLPFLAATPDRLVKVDGQLRLVEIKCPFSLFQRKTKIENQLRDKNFYLYSEGGEVLLRKTHDYYFQVQCQLNLTGIDICDFVVFVPPNDMTTVQIKRDKDFFQKQVVKVCKTFFY
ncbi:uncharacterized protein LOC117319004 [Pecten maximus]|uniref:uncharacterized protein LOC117319004 n=1 Tax=Pecten maximus TaxID=6579 RepID=UPI00145823DE|nr:uncharacterized protein LOC117319004 [Pecten maximus]